MKIVLIYVLMTLVDAQQPDTATTKRPPPGYSPQAWRPPAGGWALNSIKNNLPHPQDERLYCQNGILKDTEKPYYPYLCDPEGLLPPTTKLYIAQNLTSARKQKELCNATATGQCGGLKVGVAVISAIASVKGEDLNTYMIQFGEVILSNWNNVGSLCGGGILLLVSVNDSLMYVASDNNAANCSGGCTKLWTGGPPRTSANWLSELEKQIEEYAKFANGHHECCQKSTLCYWLPCLLFVLLLLPILIMVACLWRDWRRQVPIQVGTLLIEIGFFVLAVVLVLYFCKPIVIIAPICGLVVTIICIVLLPRVVRVCRIQWELTRLTQTLQNVVSEEMTRFMNEINREDLEKVLKKMSQDFQEAIGEEIAKVKNEFRCKYCVQLNNEELKRKLCDIYPNLLSKLKQLAADMVGESTTSGPTESDIQHVREEHNKFLNTLGSLLKGKLDEIVTSLSGNDEEKTQEVHLLTAVSS